MSQLTVARPGVSYTDPAKPRVSVMKNRIDLETIVVAVCVAGYAALLLGYVAHEDLGFSAAQIRHVAMISADLLAMPVTLGFLRTKSG